MYIHSTIVRSNGGKIGHQETSSRSENPKLQIIAVRVVLRIRANCKAKPAVYYYICSAVESRVPVKTGRKQKKKKSSSAKPKAFQLTRRMA